MASPDTDELPTTPNPAQQTPPGERTEAGQAPAGAAAEARAEADVPTARQDHSGTAQAGRRDQSGHGSVGAADRSRVAGRPAADVPAAREDHGETEQVGVASPGAEATPEAEAPTVEQERVEPERIEAPDVSPDTAVDAPARPGGRWWRGLTGSLAAGLAVLAVGVLVVGVVCLFTDAPGPGPTLLIGHPIAAVLALSAQRVADRRDGPQAVGAGLAVVLFTVSALTMFWLA
ncbi:hypothetical protein [Amycolatopsis sp. NPDC004169]|uniref:hypothetical protein n=1 Tax=Amycolatopsis sp. NPDC004169 TaxID=3154453 RepID=UPI0033AAA291